MFTDYTRAWDLHRLLAVLAASIVYASAAMATGVVLCRLVRPETLRWTRRGWTRAALVVLAGATVLVVVDIDAKYVQRAESDLVAYQRLECGSTIDVLTGRVQPGWTASDGSRPADACFDAASGRLPLVVAGVGAALLFLAVSLTASTRTRRQERDERRALA